MPRPYTSPRITILRSPRLPATVRVAAHARVLMGRHDGDEISPEEKEENAAAQTEELEALEAIYGDSCMLAAPEV